MYPSAMLKGRSIALRGGNVNVPLSRTAALPAKKTAQTVLQLNRNDTCPISRRNLKLCPSVIVELLYKISAECEADPQSNEDIRSIGRMRLLLLVGSLLMVSAIMAEAFNPTLWVRGIHLRKIMDFVVLVTRSFLVIFPHKS